MNVSNLLKPNDPNYPKPLFEIKLLNPLAYKKGKQISSSGYGVYRVSNHPDKVVKIMKLMDAPPNAMYEEDPWNELNMSFKAGQISVGPNVHGYYIKNGHIHMVMDMVQGVQLKNTNKTTRIYKDVLKLAEKLVDNGIQNKDMNMSNIIIQDDGNVIIIDYGEAYEIGTLTDSKRKNLILKMAKYAKPDTTTNQSHSHDINDRLQKKLSNLQNVSGKGVSKQNNRTSKRSKTRKNRHRYTRKRAHKPKQHMTSAHKRTHKHNH